MMREAHVIFFSHRPTRDETFLKNERNFKTLNIKEETFERRISRRTRYIIHTTHTFARLRTERERERKREKERIARDDCIVVVVFVRALVFEDEYYSRSVVIVPTSTTNDDAQK